MAAGFRRRVWIDPAPGQVTAELEDDWHRMVVSLSHADGAITDVAAEMKRWPWSSCPGAVDRLRTTFIGVALGDAARRGEKTANCTHLHDLTLFAAAHAGDVAPTGYDIEVSDPVAGANRAVLLRDGVVVLDWWFEDQRIVHPAELAGLKLAELGDWIARCDSATQEAARLLRWAAIMAFGRQMDIPAGSSAAAFPTGACYTFQPERAATSVRSERAWIDFSARGEGPLGDMQDRFARSSGRQDVFEHAGKE